MSAALLSTKLYLPTSRQGLVPRPRLTDQLNNGLSRKLTLVSAPAGFGKSTLLSEWVHSPAPGVHFAWLTLDEGDNDPARFLTYFIAALQTIDHQIGGDLMAALQAPGPINYEGILNTLINDLAAWASQVALVLDDYHVIDAPQIDDMLAYLIAHLPANLHLAIATRVDPALPLARLRGRGQLTELRTADLRFALDEVAAFLNVSMGLGLTADDIAALEARTEGWIAGLQMVAVSLQDAEDVPGFIRSFTGSHHHILDYLVEEVLRRQSPATQAFLHQTSILKHLTGSLCDAVCAFETNGSEALDGRATLERLARANLFLIPLDDERRWYRYHHLFAELLEARLRRIYPEQIPDLHLRAAKWFEQNGAATEAVDHAFAAADFERAASLVEEIASRTMNHGRVTTILRWLDALPESLLKARPRLSLYRAWAVSMAGQPRAAEKLLLDLKSNLKNLPGSPENLALRGELSAILAGIITSHNDPARIIQEAEEALNYLPEENLLSRARATLALGIACAYSNQIQKALKTYQQTRELALRAENPFLATVAVELTAGIQIYHQGRLREAAQILKEALEPGRREDGTYYAFTGLAHSLLGEINLEWNQLAAANRYLETGLKLVQRGGIGHSLIHTYCAEARLKMALGEMDRAVEALRAADQAARANPLVQFLVHNLACQVMLALRSGDKMTALAWARGHRCELPENLPVHLDELQQISLARVYLAQKEFEKTIETLDRIRDQAESAERAAHLIDIYCLKALAFQEQGRMNTALTSLENALFLAAPEGYVQTFLEFGEPLGRLLRTAFELGEQPTYVGKLLAAFEERGYVVRAVAPLRSGAPPRNSSLQIEPLIEPLTEREYEVLGLMVEGLTYNEIAGQILVSLNTVRTHVKNIYGKLDVHKRSHAIARARELRLL